MKNLFKNPLFYINIFLLILLILFSTSINPNSTNLPSFAKKAIAAVASILGQGTVNYLAAFTGVNQIGNSIIYDTGTRVGIGVTNPSQKLDVGSNNVSANDYWIQAANYGGGGWASQLGNVFTSCSCVGTNTSLTSGISPCWTSYSGGNSDYPHCGYICTPAGWKVMAPCGSYY